MKLFSYRKGLKEMRDQLQINDLEQGTRNLIWSLLYTTYWEHAEHYYPKTRVQSPLQYEHKVLRRYTESLWTNYFRQRLDTIPYSWQDLYQFIQNYFLSCQYNEVYDFIEFLIANFSSSKNEGFVSACNMLFEKEMIAYRIIDGKVSDIIDNHEINEIEEATNSRFGPVRKHISTSISFLCDRQNPDPRNSIKESISAVEAICRIITTKDQLSDALKVIDSKIKLHPALKEAFNKLYAYTNDAHGIRHALKDDADVSHADAKFMLVACSAFTNYLTEKYGK